MVTLLRKSHISKVNVRHLLDDLASSYSYSLEEAVLVELIANSLDAATSDIHISLNPKEHQVTVEDNGTGMAADEFQRYHDLAETRKERGRGIGFAGLGAKLGHKIASRVVTVTRSGSHREASEWNLKGNDLVWKNVRPRALRQDGTRVTLFVKRTGQRLLDRDFIQRTIRYHYGALLDPYLSQIYLWESIYPKGLVFHLDGERLPLRPVADLENVEVRTEVDVTGRGKKRVGRAVFVLTKKRLPEDQQGIVIATYGKTIRRDNLGVHPRQPERVTGWFESPELVECLTLDKQNFLTHGKEGQKYRRIRGEIQKAFSAWLQEIGEARESEDRRRAPRRLERETSDILRRIPELRYLYAARIRSAFATPDASGDTPATMEESVQVGHAEEPGGGGGDGVPLSPGGQDGQAPRPDVDGTSTARTRRRSATIGPRIERVSDRDRDDMSWIEGETLFINTGHSTYLLAERRNLLGYHERFVIYSALCQDAPVDPEEKLALLIRALTEWSRQ